MGCCTLRSTGPGVRQQFERRFRGRLRSIGPWSRGRVGCDIDLCDAHALRIVLRRPPSRVHGGTLQAQSQPKPAPVSATVYLTPTCGCCSKWADHLKTAGFTVTREVTVAARRRAGTQARPREPAVLPYGRHRELSCRRTRPGGSRPEAVEGTSEDRRHRRTRHARWIARDGKQLSRAVLDRRLQGRRDDVRVSRSGRSIRGIVLATPGGGRSQTSFRPNHR